MAKVKIHSFPTVPDVPVVTDQTQTGFTRSFIGDVYSNRGRIGGDENYWDISEGALTAVGASTGTVYINYGKTSFSNTTTGFILGLHNGTPKFYIGSSSQYLNWTGTALNVAGTITGSTITGSTITGATINGGTITGTTIGTAVSGERLVLGPSVGGVEHLLQKYDSSNNIVFYMGAIVTATPFCQIAQKATDQVSLNISHPNNSTTDALNIAVGSGVTESGIKIQHSGIGYDIEGTGNTWQISNIGAITAASFGGITSANLLDKSATETITGAWAFNNNITFDVGTRTIAGIQNQNLVDKSATESISGTWTFGTNFPITPSSAPTTNYQVANKKYIDDNADTSVKLLYKTTTQTTVTNTTTETDYFSYSVPGGSLSTGNILRIKLWISNYTNNNGILDLKLHYGSGDVSVSSDATQISAVKGYIEAYVLARGATNAQELILMADLMETETQNNSSVTIARWAGRSTEAIDSTSAQDLKVAVKWSVADAVNTITLEFATVELLS